MNNIPRAIKQYSALLPFVSVLLCGHVALAQGNRQPPDILGVTLSMTREQAISYLQAKHGAGQPQQITNQIYVNADYTPPPVVAAYGLDITPAGERFSQSGSNSDLCMAVPRGSYIGGSDYFCIEVSPLDNNNILAIKRVRVYPEAYQPLKTTFMQSLVGKYGEPADSSGGLWRSVWSWNDRRPSQECVSMADATGILYTNDSSSGIYQWLDYVRKSQRPGYRFKLERSCSYIMVIQMEAGGKTDEYVGGFMTIISNVAAADDAFRKYAAELHAKSQEATQKRLSTDAQNKPQL